VVKRAEMTALRAEAAELHAQLGALEQYAGPTRRDVALDDYLAGTLHYLDAAANAPGESAPLVQAMREAARVVGTVRERAAARGAALASQLAEVKARAGALFSHLRTEGFRLFSVPRPPAPARARPRPPAPARARPRPRSPADCAPGPAGHDAGGVYIYILYTYTYNYT
jgi:hypothetical protein